MEERTPRVLGRGEATRVCGGVRAAGVEPAARLRAAAARPECAAAASGARGETSLHEEVARSQG